MCTVGKKKRRSPRGLRSGGPLARDEGVHEISHA